MRPRVLLIDGRKNRHHYETILECAEADWHFEATPELTATAESSIDLAMVTDEFWSETTAVITDLVRRDIPTLHVVDGVAEWRNTWENPRSLSEAEGMPLFQPILSHKVACLGRSQARLLESWGNLGKCEVVGAPRFDRLMDRRPRERGTGEPLRLLIMTAKQSGFTPAQVACVKRGLEDVKAWLAANAEKTGTGIEPVWRLTGDLAEAAGVGSEISDLTGKDLAEVLGQVDGVITTPSTAMLEAMLHGVPVALLDYNNCPHYVPASWQITAPEHVGQVVPELLDPPAGKMLLQDTILHDALECRTPAVPRMVALIQGMAEIGRECRRAGRPLSFPRRIVEDTQGGHHLPEERFDMKRLYPRHPVFGQMESVRAAVEAGHQYLIEHRAAERAASRVAAEAERQHAAERKELDRALARVTKERERYRRRLKQLESNADPRLPGPERTGAPPARTGVRGCAAGRRSRLIRNGVLQERDIGRRMAAVSPRISVAICTLDRVSYLRKAIRSLVAQTLSVEEYEILVVDNGSGGETRRLIREEFGDVRQLQYVHEPALGLSHARNTGLRRARADYVAYLDDDGVADPHWLERILEAYEAVRPRPGCVGGKIEPIWEKPLPSWWPPQFVRALTIIDWSPEPIFISEKQYLAGTNMSYPREVLLELGGFYANLDRRGKNLLSSGDTHMQHELARHGYRCYYHPDIVVHHHVPAERLTKRWFLRRGWWQGASNAVFRICSEGLSPGERRSMAASASRELLGSFGRLAALLRPTDSKGKMWDKYMTVREMGWILGLLGILK